MEFAITTSEIKNNADRISNIASGTMTNTIAVVCHVSEGIDIVSRDLRVPLQAIVNNLRRNQMSLQRLSDAARLITARYEIAEMNIVQAGSINGASGDNDVSANAGNNSCEDFSQGIFDALQDAWRTVCRIADRISISFTELISLFSDIKELFGELIDKIGSGWGIEEWQTWFLGYVPNHVNDASILAIYEIFTGKSLTSTEIAEHYQTNLTGWENYVNNHPNDTYIEDQNSMSDLVYGDCSANENGCGTIATYNALIALNNGSSPVSFPDVISAYEGNGLALNGKIGTSPMAVYDYFQDNGYDVNMLQGSDIDTSNLNDMQANSTTYIMMSYNDANDVSRAVHYVSITEEVGSNGQVEYVIHNANGETHFNSLEEAVNGYNNGNGEPICVIGIS